MDSEVLQDRQIFTTIRFYTLLPTAQKGFTMQSIYLIDHNGKFRGSFSNIRDAKN